MEKQKIAVVLGKHNKWLIGAPAGERADLRRADLRRADLQGADLDLSAFPLSCESFNMIVDNRLVYQLICHITRLDIKNCSQEIKTTVELLKPSANCFCAYRNDVEKI